MNDGFAELAATTNFSFLRGASHAQEIVARAAELGLAAIGIADRNTLAGVVRGWSAAKQLRETGIADIRVLTGARLVTECGFEAVAYPIDRAAYGRLSRLLTAGNRCSKKGDCRFGFDDLIAAAEGQMLIAMPPRRWDEAFERRLAELCRAAPRRTYLGATCGYRGDDARRISVLAALAEKTGARLIASNDVLYHEPSRRPLADVLACIRHKCSIRDAGYRLEANAERHVKGAAEMARLFAGHPRAISRTLEIVDAIRFDLSDLTYAYPDEPVPAGSTPQEHLETLTWSHARAFYGELPDKLAATLKKELALIRELRYAPYFLTVYDIVRFARSREILCQGRGSAANSAVCFVLGITSVNPDKFDLLFERFVSVDRREPPDIDVDFEHERREEVIQYVYRRYGRERAAICATVIHYRPRMAIREVGKAMGLTEDVTAALAGMMWGSWGDTVPDTHIRDAGLDPDNPSIRQAVSLAILLIGFPRHLSQHVGGFVLTRERLDETVPILNGAMPDRTFIEWDKDDIDALGLLKVDVLALGMLTAVRRALDFIARHYERPLSLATIPQDDPKVYDMLCEADSLGVFQVESRAQMSMLPRLRPREFYDLVIEVAIVRPGPIQGDMVHPYLRRRAGTEPVTFPSQELEAVLRRTMGVPLFQEQAMRIAIVAAGFSPSEADKLRRAMATFRHTGTIHTFREKFISGMTGRGYERDFAERCFSQIEGFGEYGFPESHAASFALLVYVSAWIKCHYPDAFCAALLNSQPMGFYQPAQLVRDAREHGVQVREADVNASDWDCTLEAHSLSPSLRGEGQGEGPQPARQRAAAPHPSPLPVKTGRGDGCTVRLGLRLIAGLAEDEIRLLIDRRGSGYRSAEDLLARTGVRLATLERLAAADAFRSLGLDRRQALWAVKGLAGRALPKAERDGGALGQASIIGPETGDLFAEPEVALPETRLSEHVAEDYTATGLSLKAHPVAFFRDELRSRGAITSAEHWEDRYKGRRITVAGLVLVRQRPGTAKGVIFLTMEDETGPINVIVWPKTFLANRRVVMTSQFLMVTGRLEREGLVSHVIAERFVDLTGELRRLSDGEAGLPDQEREVREGSWRVKSRDFH